MVEPTKFIPLFFKSFEISSETPVLARISEIEVVDLRYSSNCAQQYLDFLIMRIRTMLLDTRMSSIIGTEGAPTLVDWIDQYIGRNASENGELAIIDLSLVPVDIVHTVVAVIARIIFEALQRYRRSNGEVLPTVLVMEEAHNFIAKPNSEIDEAPSSRLCSQTFEKIAKEGRKFGLRCKHPQQHFGEAAQN